MHTKSGPILIIGGASWNQVIHLDDQLPAQSFRRSARTSYEKPGGLGLGKAANQGGITANIDIVENLGGEAVFNLDVYGHTVRILYHRSGAEKPAYQDVIADGRVDIDLAVPSAMFFADE